MGTNNCRVTGEIEDIASAIGVLGKTLKELFGEEATRMAFNLALSANTDQEDLDTIAQLKKMME